MSNLFDTIRAKRDSRNSRQKPEYAPPPRKADGTINKGGRLTLALVPDRHARSIQPWVPRDSSERFE